MTLVKFASKCDDCGRRSEAYTEWTRCRDCENHCCGRCAAPGSERDEDRTTGGGEDGPEVSYEVRTVLCRACAVNHPDPNPPEPERERHEDDGSAYGHPGDYRRGLE